MDRRTWKLWLLISLLTIPTGMLTSCSDSNADQETEVLDETALSSESETVEETTGSSDQTTSESETEETTSADSANQGVEISVSGSAGTITLTIPEGWSFNLCPEGSDSLELADYGIQFYPEDSIEGCIEVGYLENFGTTDTGVVKQETTLAGDTAMIITFEDAGPWTFITFEGENEGIISCADTAGWWLTEKEEEVFSILDTLQLTSDDTTTTTDASAAKEENANLSITLTITEITDGVATVVIDNQSDSVFTFSPGFSLEKKEDEEWVEVPYADDASWDDTSYDLESLDSITLTVDLTAYWGELEDGTYRLVLGDLSTNFTLPFSE